MSRGRGKWHRKRGKTSERMGRPTAFRAQPTVYCRTCYALERPEKIPHFKPHTAAPCPDGGGPDHEAWLYGSAKEARYARELDWRVKMGLIRTWRWRQTFPLNVNGQCLPDFEATFLVIELDGTERLVSCKPWGPRAAGWWRYTLIYRLHSTHQQLVRALYGYEIETI